MIKGTSRGMVMEAQALLSASPTAANSDLPPSMLTMTGALAASPTNPAKKAASAYSS